MLYLTSLIFLTNAGYAFTKGLTIYGIFFLALTSTSVLYHMCDIKEPILFWYDQVMVWLVISIGFLYFLHIQPTTQLGPLCAFITVAALYVGVCFSPLKETQTAFHALMHIVSSIGHHVLISAV